MLPLPSYAWFAELIEKEKYDSGNGDHLNDNLENRFTEFHRGSGPAACKEFPKKKKELSGLCCRLAAVN